MEETIDQLGIEEMPENEVNRLIKIGFKGYTNKKLVKSKVGGIILSARYANMAKKIRTFEFRSDDIIVMTYPKSGTTWLQETLWSMRHSHELHLAKKESISQRTYFIDADGLYSLDHQMSMKPQLNRFRSLCPGKNPEDGIVMQLAAASNTPRVIKTHLPLSVYPRSLLDVCKVVYVCRDPRDVCVSYYHHCRFINTYQYVGSFDDFAQCFMADDLFYGGYWQHITSAWMMKEHSNLHFLFYEDMKINPSLQMRNLREFLKFPLSDAQLDIIVDHASFKSMKERDRVVPMTFSSTTNSGPGSFFRKGVIGDWKNIASQTLDSEMSLWIQQQSKSLFPHFDKYLQN